MTTGTHTKEEPFPNHQYLQVTIFKGLVGQYLPKVLLGIHPIKVLLTLIQMEDLGDTTTINLEGPIPHIEYQELRPKHKLLKLNRSRKKVLLGNNQYLQRIRVKQGVWLRTKHKIWEQKQ